MKAMKASHLQGLADWILESSPIWHMQTGLAHLLIYKACSNDLLNVSCLWPDLPSEMEVGIEECLHIEFEYDRAKYHLKDTVVGKIYFLLVRIKLKHMEVEIRRRETTGSGQQVHNENETLAKYEIMDGAPVRGEAIPIRLFLSPYDLTPTYTLVHNKFSVRYFLNLVLVDEEDRRYFKQQEIQLYRASDASQANGVHVAAATLVT